MAFASALWTPRKGVLVATIARHTGLAKAVVNDVLRYLTFGEMGIRNPDIATQPIVDLTNGQYAISPFVMAHVHAERNLCVLLNQIPDERKLYLQLVEEKEQQVRNRSYLPRKDHDYKITEVEIQSGEWHSRWYGIVYA